MRIQLIDIRRSRLPGLIGLCPDNRPEIAAAINEATQRLMYSFGETGAYAGWAKVVFTASRTSPYITLPREFARAINLAVCRHPFRIQNQFYELLPGGPGLSADVCNASVDWCGEVQGYDRGNVPSMVDLPSPMPTGGWILRLYWTDVADAQAGKRILIKAKDALGTEIFSQDGVNHPQGFYLQADQMLPFVDSTPITVSTLDAVTKDETLGQFILKAVDPVTGLETLLSQYGPTELSPAYRRYIITQLPANCCPTVTPPQTTVQITALCKLEYAPVALDTDYLIIGNIPALIEECQSIRYSEMDNPASASKAEYHHKRAIRQLQNEMRHYMGEQVPAVSVDRWNGQPLQDQNVGSMR